MPYATTTTWQDYALAQAETIETRVHVFKVLQTPCAALQTPSEHSQICAFLGCTEEAELKNKCMFRRCFTTGKMKLQVDRHTDIETLKPSVPFKSVLHIVTHSPLPPRVKENVR